MSGFGFREEYNRAFNTVTCSNCKRAFFASATDLKSVLPMCQKCTETFYLHYVPAPKKIIPTVAGPVTLAPDEDYYDVYNLFGDYSGL